MDKETEPKFENGYKAEEQENLDWNRMKEGAQYSQPHRDHAAGTSEDYSQTDHKAHTAENEA